MDLEAFTANYIANQNNPNQRLIDPNGIITIPVVVHVLHRGEAVGTGGNISFAQIQSQIDVLNEDFRRLNADAVNTPSAFAGVASDYGFQFTLACEDPNGNSTNGVTRTLASRDNFTLVSNSSQIDEVATGIKFTQTGGKDAWPANRYLNIWVASMGRGILGYATFPADFSTRANVDGIVIRPTAMGRVGNVAAPYHLGRTATHEVGHWLNLRHIWGDADCGDDFVGDTPEQQAENYGCQVFPHQSNCPNNGPNGDMFMNYMDYGFDNCLNTYTNGQRLRGRAIFSSGGPRDAFINNYFSIQDPGSLFCTGVVKINNPGCLSVTWSVVSGPASIASSTNTQVSLNINASGSVLLRATGGNYISEINISVSYAAPPSLWVDIQPIGGNDCYEQNRMYYFSVANPQPGIQYKWGLYTPNGGPFLDPWQTNMTTASFSFNEEGSYGVLAYPYTINTCGEGTYSEYAIYVNPFWESCNDFRAFEVETAPNPTKGDVYVTIKEEKPEFKKLSKQENIKIELYDFHSNSLMKYWNYKNDSKQWKLNVGELKKGKYVLVITIGKYRQSKQIIIE